MNHIWIPHLHPLRSIQDLPGSSRRSTALWEGLQGVGIDPAPGARRGKIEGRWLVYHLSSVTCWNWGSTKPSFLINQPMGFNGNLGHLWNDPQMVSFPQFFPRWKNVNPWDFYLTIEQVAPVCDGKWQFFTISFGLWWFAELKHCDVPHSCPIGSAT